MSEPTRLQIIKGTMAAKTLFDLVNWWGNPAECASFMLGWVVHLLRDVGMSNRDIYTIIERADADPVLIARMRAQADELESKKGQA